MENNAQIANPFLKPLGVLVGTWKTEGKHPLIPGTALHGNVTFEWMENGAYLRMATTVDHPKIPDGLAIFGSDNGDKQFFMLYFDERGISRKYDVSFENNVLKWWRDNADFSQRYTVTFEEDGKTMHGKGEMRRDGKAWEGDLELEYSRST